MGWRSDGVFSFLLSVATFASLSLHLATASTNSRFFDVNPDFLCQEWSHWSTCTKSCDSGVEQRKRLCKWKDFEDNAQQMFYQTRTSSCNNFPCPAWGDWTDWSECSVSCGGGITKRDRTCNNFQMGIQSCNGPNNETKACGVEQCPYWSGWTEWATCSASCAGGTQDRNRDCNHQEGGELICIGEKYEKRECSKFFCPYWSDWSNWSGCDVTCGNGTRQMTRTCIRDPKGDAYCVGDEKIVGSCVLNTCAQWEGWSQWTDCPVTCGNGNITRHRRCSNEDGSIGECPGSPIDVSECQLESCPRWTEWTKWSDCSARCGGGVQDRRRDCLKDPGSIFKCDGHSSENQACALFYCPYWGEWSDWSVCSSTCGQGTETKARACNSSPASGLSCDGSTEMTRPCTRPECPYWHPWSDWTECDASCDGGKRHRQRTCKKMNGFDCTGPGNETSVCAPYPCPVWSQWSSWSECDATCDGGKMTKARKCIVDANSGFRCQGLGKDYKACGQIPCRDCTPKLLNCDFSVDTCSFITKSRSPLAFFLRRDPRGFLETYAPFAKMGDWAELQSVVFKACMEGTYCLTVRQNSGSTEKRMSKNLIVVRSANHGERVIWQRPDEPSPEEEIIKVEIDIHPSEQVVFKITKDTKGFEYLWIHDISTEKGNCT